MGLSLKQSNGIQALAGWLRDFLPGGGAKHWKGHINFGTVARDVGVGEFWSEMGSKQPRIARLLERTLTEKPQYFERLVVAIVRQGLLYRSSKKNPIRPEEIKAVNGHLMEVGFQFPDLWDSTFLGALEFDDAERAARNVSAVERTQVEQVSEAGRLRATLDGLSKELHGHFVESDRQRAGLALEKILNSVFGAFGLDPRAPFRVTGEQIDGSFELDQEVYLLEAKWQKAPTPESDLLVFRSKVQAKSAYTRGVFVSMNGLSREAEDAITRGKQPLFFVITGHDVMMVLQGAMPLDTLLRRRRRLLGEEGLVCAPFSRIA